MHVSALYIYPVKSLRGCAVESADVDALGLVGDRRFMVVDPDGKCLTQRALPRMALVHTSIEGDELVLSAAGVGNCRVARTSASSLAPPLLRSVSIWKSPGLLADDAGDEAAAWLSAFLGVTCRLVRVGKKFIRPMLASNIAGPGDQISFTDAYPLLMISVSSLADLNDRLVAQGEEAVPMNRFRPNLVVSGTHPYAEDEWTRFRISALTFHSSAPCARCILTTTDQETAGRGTEPLRTLAAYRRDATEPGNVTFGQNVIHETKSGTLRVGDPVELIA